MTIAQTVKTAQEYLDEGYLLDGAGLICGRSETHPRGAINFDDPPVATPRQARLPRSAKVLSGRKKTRKAIEL